MRRLLLCVVASTVLLSACAGGKSRLKVGQSDAGEVVEAEGLAPNDPKDLIATKRASLVDAQRNAVEKAVGVYVSARTLVEKAVAIENNILAKTAGYIKKYDILSEGPKDDLYYTRIRALVSLQQIQQDLRELSLTNVPELKKPRVVIDIVESADKDTVEDAPAATSLQRILSDSGFIIVSADRLKEADLVVKGKASSFPFQGEGLGGFISYRARITLQVLRAGSNDVVTSVTQEASGLGGNKDLAALKSLEVVGEMAGRDLSMSVPDLWTKSKRLIVFVEGVKSFADVERVRKHFSAQTGVEDLSMRLYNEESAQFELQLAGTDNVTLAAALESSQTLPLKVLDSSGAGMRVRLP